MNNCHKETHRHTHTCTHSHTHTHTHKHTHTCAHARTHTHTHTPTFSRQNSLFQGWPNSRTKYFSSTRNAAAASSPWKRLAATVFWMTWMNCMLRVVTPPCCTRQVWINLLMVRDRAWRSLCDRSLAGSWYFRYKFLACSRWSMTVVLGSNCQCYSLTTTHTSCDLFTGDHSCIVKYRLTCISAKTLSVSF